MWVIAKIKKNNLNLFVSGLKKIDNNIKIYYPKVFYKNKYKNILENYIFCYHTKFKGNIHKHFNYIRGLIYFLDNNEKNQTDIIQFINCCRKHENKKGFLQSSFFKEDINKTGKFLNGPFANYLFEVALKEKNKLKILLGNFNLTVSDNNNILYQTI